MALTKDTPVTFETGYENTLPVKASTTIYNGAAVGDSSGYARPLNAGDKFMGFAMGKVINSGGNGALKVEVKTRGLAKLAVTGATAVTNVGDPVYASDDGTFTLTQSTNSLIGSVYRWVSSGVAIVEFFGGPDVVAPLGGTLTGSVDGDLADVADIALSTSNTYTDAAVNTAVNTAIASVNLQLKELQTKVNELALRKPV